MKLNSIPYVLLYMCFIKHSLVFPPFQCLSFSHDVFLYRIIFGKSVLHRTKSDCMMRKLFWVQSYKWFQQACLISAPSQFIFFIFLSKLLSTFSLRGTFEWQGKKSVKLWEIIWNIYFLTRAEDYSGKNGFQRLVILYLCITFGEFTLLYEMSCWKKFSYFPSSFLYWEKNKVRKLHVSVTQKEGLSQNFAFIIWSCEHLV